MIPSMSSLSNDQPTEEVYDTARNGNTEHD